MNAVYAPGCALVLYKPRLAQKTLEALRKERPGVPEHLTCCRHEPRLPAGTRVINTCPGCDRRYRELYEGITTVSLWEILAESGSFPFPDYEGRKMAILDACPTREETRVHDAVRTLLRRMNVRIVEPRKTRTYGVCCGDSAFGSLPVDQVKGLMKKRAAEMPAEDVAVYCVSCVKAIFIGGKRPRYLVDLLFGEETLPGTLEPDDWHAELDRFIEKH
jgi:Fe-S oxidoreductase